MNAQTSPTARQIYWPSVVTVISAAILIGAEVFGAAFAGGWALAILLPPESLYLPFTQETWAHIVQAVLFSVTWTVSLTCTLTVSPFCASPTAYSCDARCPEEAHAATAKASIAASQRRTR